MITILTIAVIALIVERVVEYAMRWQACQMFKKWSKREDAFLRELRESLIRDARQPTEG